MSRESRIQNQITDIENAACSTDEKLIRILQLGCEQFGLMLGLISKVEDDAYIVIAAYPDGLLNVGDRFDLNETICDVTMRDQKLVSFSKASGTDWVTHPAYEKFSIEAYIGLSYELENGNVGTLNFSSPTALSSDFSDEDKQIMKRLSDAVIAILATE